MNIEQIRSDFPILHQELYGKPLVYLDNAATTQKPQCVIDAVRHYYEKDNSNIHRGVHFLSSSQLVVSQRTIIRYTAKQ